MILKKIRKDKKGVSPVIGVILMVAATIVIAAVVIAMLGGFSAPGKAYAISVTAEDRAGNLYITYNGGPDAASVTGFNTTVDGSIPGEELAATVGSVLEDIENGDAGAGNDHVVVVATFIDGTEQVILDTWV